MQTYGSLITNVLLAIITFWYARLTHTIAKSSESSAESAERAALATLAANELMAATAKVDFQIRHYYHQPRMKSNMPSVPTEGTDEATKAKFREAIFTQAYAKGLAGFEIEVRDAAVVLHGVRLEKLSILKAYLPGPPEVRGIEVMTPKVEAKGNYPLTIFPEDPAFVGWGDPEGGQMASNDDVAKLPPEACGQVVEYMCMLTYSFGMQGHKIERPIGWRKTDWTNKNDPIRTIDVKKQF